MDESLIQVTRVLSFNVYITCTNADHRRNVIAEHKITTDIHEMGLLNETDAKQKS